jgi:hypothetical protein
MNLEQAKSVVERYHEVLKETEAAVANMGQNPSQAEAMKHARFMLERLESFLEVVEEAELEEPCGKQWDKFNRWLGFMQAILWVNHIYTLDELRGHNRGEISS